MTKRAVSIWVQGMYFNEYHMIDLCSVSPDISWVFIKIIIKGISWVQAATLVFL